VVERLPSLFLRVEVAAVLAAALALYFELGYEWWLLVLSGRKTGRIRRPGAAPTSDKVYRWTWAT
jgi:hypothetical protein